MKNILIVILLALTGTASSQAIIKRALFLGNSYTAVNNLPQMTASAASSVGDSLIFDSNTPGGYTLQQHSADITSLGKIAFGTWDYVVLQEQSQLPSFPIEQVDTEVFPYAKRLDSIILAEDSCAQVVFYMTWGREYGDSSNCASWPPVCTYNGMDSMLNLRYTMMADTNHSELSPVGAVRHYIRNNFPTIQMYQPDQSHPTVAGTYVAACTFYTAFFRKDPTLITYTAGLADSDAAHIRLATKLLVYDSMSKWHIGAFSPLAGFSIMHTGTNQITFTNTSVNATSYTWIFGDGTNTTSINPIHTYPDTGSYTVVLIAQKCGVVDTFTQTVNVTTTATNSLNVQQETSWSIYPSPVTSVLFINTTEDKSLKFRICNTMGSTMQMGSISKFKNKINVSELPAGVYYISLVDGGISLGYRYFVK